MRWLVLTAMLTSFLTSGALAQVDNDVAATLQPPRGWTRQSASDNGGSSKIRAVWEPAPTRRGESITLRMEPAAASLLDDYIANTIATLKKSPQTASITTSRAEQVCDGERDGWFLQAGATIRKVPVVIEQVV